MENSIRVLHVDDEPDFTDLTATSLEREDDRFTVETATSAADGLDQLSDAFDCVISDYDMPRQNGIEFLEAVREEYPELPFILFTGKGSEEVASDAISAGVTDYLQKKSSLDQFTVLANRITNAVAQSWTEQRLQEQRQRFQILFERLTQPTVEFEYQNGDPIVQQVNPSFEAVFGYEAADIIGSSLDDAIVPDGEPDVSQIDQRARSGDGLDPVEVSRHTADGTREFLLQNATYADGSGGFAIYTDITERKARKRQLEDKNARLSLLFEQLPEPTLSYVYQDGEPYIEQVNDAFVRTFGYDREEAVGKPVDDLLVPPDRQDEAEQIDQQVQDGELVDELLCRQTDEGEREFRFRNILLPDDDALDGYGVYADVTKLRAREEQLRAEQQRFQTLFEQLTYPMVELEYDGSDPIVTAVNPAFEETFGYDESRIVGEPLDDSIVPDDQAADAESIHTPERSADCSVSKEVTRQTADGLREFLLESHVYEDNSAGFAIYTDITERKRREQVLNELHNATRELMDAQSREAVADRAVETAKTVLDKPINGLWFYDADEDVLQPVSMTDDAQALVGDHPTYARGEGLSWDAFEDGELRAYDDVRTEPGRYNPETSIRSEIIVPLGDHGVMNFGSTDTGDFSEIDVSLARVLGKSVEAALTRADREQQLRAQQATLEQQNERLEQFASVVSHDLRNPLRVANTRLELLRKECDSDHVDPIDRSLSRMDSIIENVLWLARQGRDIGEVGPVDLEDVVTAAWSIASETDTDSSLVVDSSDGLGRIEADADRLQQLLENLLRNSVEHGSTGSLSAGDADGHDVTVTVGRLADGFYVADDGPGIPESEQDTVLEIGYSTADSGTGIGLSIVKQIVDAHGWEITVTDSNDGGARFEITGVTGLD